MSFSPCSFFFITLQRFLRLGLQWHGITTMSFVIVHTCGDGFFPVVPEECHAIQGNTSWDEKNPVFNASCIN